jgi:hypothetical protein
MSINKKKKKKKKFGHRTYSLSSTSFSLKMASRNKLLPVWGSHLGNTRGWERGTFFTTGDKFKDFQLCLPILPAYLPLKFPNGQFPLKTPGPISPTTLEQIIIFFYTWWGIHVGGTGVLLCHGQKN